MITIFQNYKGPSAKYTHEHDTPINVNKEYKENLTFGQKSADWVANMTGCWKFIIIQTFIIIFWAGMNIYLVLHPTLS